MSDPALYTDESGVTFVQFQKDWPGVPLGRLLPDGAADTEFAPMLKPGVLFRRPSDAVLAPVEGYFEYAKVWLMTERVMRELPVGKVRVLLDTEGLGVVRVDGSLDVERLVALFAVVGRCWSTLS